MFTQEPEVILLKIWFVSVFAIFLHILSFGKLNHILNLFSLIAITLKILLKNIRIYLLQQNPVKMALFTMRLASSSLLRTASNTKSPFVNLKNTISLSSALPKRIRGPEEEAEKVKELHHWKNERYVMIALLPTIPAALLYPNAICDYILVSSMVLHSHWRLSGVAEDYIHGFPGKVAQPLVLFLSICAFGSLCYLNYNDIGFSNAVRMLYPQL